MPLAADAYAGRRLFPLMPLTFVVDRGVDRCPHCGETRVTDCIHGTVTMLCGFSRTAGKEVTPCQGKHWEPFIERA